jgi:hypothetical protein
VPEGWTHISSLTILLRAYLFSDQSIKRIIRPARARKLKKQMFHDFLPSAYFICNELVIRAKNDEEIKEEIWRVLKILLIEDELARPYLSARIDDESWDRFVAPCLVYWGFYSPWEKLNVAPFQTPEALSHQYIHGENRKQIARLLNRRLKWIPPLISS